MTHYIDGFILPVPRDQLQTYREVVEKVAEIWKEHGALDYSEYVGDNSNLEGTRSFTDVANIKEDEVVIFGWVSFKSREARDLANKRVAADPRMTDLINPLTNTSRPIFDAERMVYGGFRSLVQSSNQSTV
ncbi:DUF1428 domain-containing protein [Motiliproteus sp. MSK22-1]|uniref:DUF1428 domain-containing protein n=1 Tax=Motiliproteus sp. MSK22-1 TaxID=1897630 RepID=UPI000975C809|nr:DUF1428 domain-containing protein [Motiliproteus sp. MSK22-1]OMH37989.1 hypothetical protein BGP75_06795 [Motiliproteus sp. MSK22-1]